MQTQHSYSTRRPRLSPRQRRLQGFGGAAVRERHLAVQQALRKHPPNGTHTQDTLCIVLITHAHSRRQAMAHTHSTTVHHSPHAGTQLQHPPSSTQQGPAPGPTPTQAPGGTAGQQYVSGTWLQQALKDIATRQQMNTEMLLSMQVGGWSSIWRCVERFACTQSAFDRVGIVLVLFA